MQTETAADLGELIERIDAAVALGEAEAITQRIKADLAEIIRERGLALPERFLEPHPERYARRLLHRDPATGWTAVVMVWGPSQRTALHDHAGIWCVEGVVDGELEVHRYERLDLGCDNEGEPCRFRECECLRTGIGSSGALIPPHEYHILGNPNSSGRAVTLHIYGSEMDHCSIFEALGDGTYVRRERQLSYDA